MGLQWRQPPIGVADANQNSAETDKGKRPQSAAEIGNVGQNYFADDQAEAEQRSPAEPGAAPFERRPEPGCGEGQPGGRIGVPFRFAGKALVQAVALEEMADFEGHPEKEEARGENQRGLPKCARTQPIKAEPRIT